MYEDGAISHREADISLSIARKLGDYLRYHNRQQFHKGRDVPFKITFTHQGKGASLSKQISVANNMKADLFISIHCNAATDDAVTGIEIFSCSGASNQSKRYQKTIQKRLISVFPMHKNRGAKEANFYVLRKTKMPAVLIETEFLSNQKMVRWLSSKHYQSEIAEAISDAIISPNKIRLESLWSALLSPFK